MPSDLPSNDADNEAPQTNRREWVTPDFVEIPLQAALSANLSGLSDGDSSAGDP